MQEYYLVAISIFYPVFIFLFVVIDFSFNSDKFSAVKIASYFALLEAFVMLWFSLSPGAIEEHVFSQISERFHHISYVFFAYCLSLITYFFVIVGVFFGSYVFRGGALVLGSILRLQSIERAERNALGFCGFVLYIAGFFLYLVFISKVGGLFHLWADISQRTVLSAGLGYYQSLYTFFIYIGSCFLYVLFVSKKRWLFLCVMLSLSSFILVSLGQRAPFAMFCFMLIVVHHYSVKPFASFFNKKILCVGFCLIAFMFLLVQFRPMQESEDFLSKFERDVILRLGVIERQVSVLGYFDAHDYWYFGLYQSLLYAPIPRGFFSEKPPIDTGVYLNAIRQGQVITPPVPVEDLEASSWPDGFLAGYVSFGLIGLISLCLMSGFFYGSVYSALRSSGSISAAAVYAMVGFLGVVPLSPFGIVYLAMTFVPFSVLGFLTSFRIKRV